MDKGGGCRYSVVGQSMEFFLRTGDSLYSQNGASGRPDPRLGDIVVTMGAKEGSPLLVHRLLLGRGLKGASGIFLTKGDFHWVPDSPSHGSALVAVPEAVHRTGWGIVVLRCRLAYAFGIFHLFYACGSLFCYRLGVMCAWLIGILLLYIPRVPLRVLVFFETGYLSLLLPFFRGFPDVFFRALVRHASSRHPETVQQIQSLVDKQRAASDQRAFGAIREDTEWSGTVLIDSDIVVLPGVTLTLRPGTRIIFSPKQHFHHDVRRRADGRVKSLGPRTLCHLIVYGTLRADGTGCSPVVFTAEQEWGGLVFLGEGKNSSLCGVEINRTRTGMRCLDAAVVVLNDSRWQGFSGEGVGIELSDLASGFFRHTNVEGFETGLRLRDQAALEIDASTLSGNGVGVVTMGHSAAQLKRCVWTDNQTGLWAQERSSCQIFKGCFRGPGRGVRLTQKAVVEAKYLRFRRHKIAMLLEDSSVSAVVESVFHHNESGIKADGRSFLTLQGVRIRGCTVDAVWGGADVRLDIINSLLHNNSTAIHCHRKGLLFSDGNVFRENHGKDIRLF